jgi:hypothetical protein
MPSGVPNSAGIVHSSRKLMCVIGPAARTSPALWCSAPAMVASREALAHRVPISARNDTRENLVDAQNGSHVRGMGAKFQVVRPKATGKLFKSKYSDLTPEMVTHLCLVLQRIQDSGRVPGDEYPS